MVLNGRTAEKIEKAAASLRDEGFAAHGSIFDVVDCPAVEAGSRADRGEDRRRSTSWSTMPACSSATPLEEFPDDKWQLLLQTNVTGVFNVGKAVARRMIPRGRGKIINIASVQSELARPGIAPYTATKGAVKNLTKGMCTDWAKHGLQVNAIAPGYFRTELNQALVDDPEFSAWLEQATPAGRWGDVEELVGAAVFLASDASSFVNGHVLYVDGGITASL